MPTLVKRKRKPCKRGSRRNKKTKRCRKNQKPKIISGDIRKYGDLDDENYPNTYRGSFQPVIETPDGKKINGLKFFYEYGIKNPTTPPYRIVQKAFADRNPGISRDCYDVDARELFINFFNCPYRIKMPSFAIDLEEGFTIIEWKYEKIND